MTVVAMKIARFSAGPVVGNGSPLAPVIGVEEAVERFCESPEGTGELGVVGAGEAGDAGLPGAAGELGCALLVSGDGAGAGLGDGDGDGDESGAGALPLLPSSCCSVAWLRSSLF